jgi:DNA-3-methyladenine glycosylase II
MDYLAHLKKDKKLASIIQEPPPSLQLKKNIPLQLIASIMSQQLSTKVAKVIYDRFLGLYNNIEPSPADVLATNSTTLRSIGLSNAKVQYVQNVAAFCIEHSITDKKMKKLTEDEIIDLLTQIKGVGRWTVEMLLMFSLGREDVFTVDDLGIQQAMMKLYKLNTDDKKQLKQQMQKIALKWSPYRTYACLYLWQWKDAK